QKREQAPRTPNAPRVRMAAEVAKRLECARLAGAFGSGVQRANVFGEISPRLAAPEPGVGGPSPVRLRCATARPDLAASKPKAKTGTGKRSVPELLRLAVELFIQPLPQAGHLLHLLGMRVGE